jgi:hypothetical protein
VTAPKEFLHRFPPPAAPANGSPRKDENPPD